MHAQQSIRQAMQSFKPKTNNLNEQRTVGLDHNHEPNSSVVTSEPFIQPTKKGIHSKLYMSTGWTTVDYSRSRHDFRTGSLILNTASLACRSSVFRTRFSCLGSSQLRLRFTLNPAQLGMFGGANTLLLSAANLFALFQPWMLR
jgi:hypothetical protein